MDKQAKDIGAMAALGLATASALLFAGCGGGGGGGSSSTTSSSPTASSSTTLTPPAPPAIPTFPTTTTAAPAVDQTQTLSNLRKVGLALAQYVQDYDQTLPVAQSAQVLQPLLMPYARDSTIFVDANTSLPFAWNVSLSGASAAQFPDFSTILTLYDNNPPLTDARPVVFLNGQTSVVTDSQWQILKTSNHIP